MDVANESKAHIDRLTDLVINLANSVSKLDDHAKSVDAILSRLIGLVDSQGRRLDRIETVSSVKARYLSFLLRYGIPLFGYAGIAYDIVKRKIM